MSPNQAFTRQYRAPISDPASGWSADRRALYLLRPEVARPLSIDPVVWPSAQGGVEIAASVVAGPSKAEAEGFAGSLGQAEVPSNEAWILLGYDVADSGFTSGLSNCGYRPDLDDVEGLRRDWAPRLNAGGLFDDLEHAIAFRALSDGRIPEHAPFYVYALYKKEAPGSG